MISEYVSFNAARFVKDYYKAKGIVRRLEEQLNSMDFITGVSTDRDAVQTSRGTSQTEGLALRRIALEDRIAGYRDHIETCEKAFKCLTEDEREVIEQFFTSSTKTAATVKLAERGISRTVAYEIRTRALKKIAEDVSGITNIRGGE